MFNSVFTDSTRIQIHKVNAGSAAELLLRLGEEIIVLSLLVELEKLLIRCVG